MCTSSSETFWALTFSRSISTKSCGWVTLKVREQADQSRVACCLRRPGSARPLAATASPAPRRSCTCSLKPPVLPRPSTGGAPKTAIWASWISLNLLRAASAAMVGRAQFRVSRPLFKRLQDDEHAAHVADVRAQNRRVAGHVDRVGDAFGLAGDLAQSAGRARRCGPGWRRRASWALTTR